LPKEDTEDRKPTRRL